MANKLLLKTDFAVQAKYDAYFTGQHVQITKDGDSLLCECGDGVGVVTLATGRVTGRISCEEDQVTCIALAPDNSSILVALKSTSLQQYEWPSLQLVRSFRSYHRGPVTVMSWDTTSTLVITGAADSSARIWDLQKRYCTHSLKGASGVFGAVLFERDLSKQPRVFGAVGNLIHVWKLDAGSSSLVSSLDGHHSAVTALAMTDDDNHLVSCGLDRVIVLWELESMTSKKVVPVYESLSGFLLQPKGTLFPGVPADSAHIYGVVVGDKGVPAVWEVDTGRQVWKASAPLLTPPDQEGVTLINQLTYSAALDSVVMTTYDHNILLTKTATMEVWKQLAGYNDQILDTVFAGEGDSHLVVATNSAQLRIYNCESFGCHLVQGHSALVLSLSRHPTQPQIFASSSHDNSARIWKLCDDGTAITIATAKGHTSSIGCVTLSQGFMVTGSRDMCIKKWILGKDIEAPKPLGSNAIVSLASTYTEKAHAQDINSICVSINCKLLATGSQDKTAKVWNCKDLSLMGILRGHRRGVWCVQFSPVDEVLATASADATVKIWTLTDFSNALTLEGHSVSVLQLRWISEGQQLITTGSDGLLKLWTVKTRQCVQTYDEHSEKAWALAVSKDEKIFVTGGEDAKLIQWKDITEEERDKAAQEAARFAAEEQTLSNLIQDKKWTKALAIAIRLDQPLRALKIVKAILDETPDQLTEVLHKLRDDQIASILGFASQWNTKTKNSREAQTIIHIILKHYLPEEIEAFGDWQQTLEGLLPYTERHLRRLSALYQASSILSYMSASISLKMDSKGFELPLMLDNKELLQSIDNPIDGEIENIDIKTEEEEEEEEDLKAAVMDSIMEVDSEAEASESNDIQVSFDNDESDNLKNGEKLYERDTIKEPIIPPTSVDDLDANFVVEKVEAESSEEEEDSGMEDDNEMHQSNNYKEKAKRKSFSIDHLPINNKRERGNTDKINKIKGGEGKQNKDRNSCSELKFGNKKSNRTLKSKGKEQNKQKLKKKIGRKETGLKNKR